MKKILLSLLFITSLSNAQSAATIDPAFNVPTVWEAGKYIYDMAMQPDGKVIIVSSVDDPDLPWFRMVERLNTDGSADNTFTPLIDYNINGFTCPIAIQPDGDILLGGSFAVNSIEKAVVRLNPDGSIDTGFNCPSSIQINYVNTIALQPDGKILVGGDFTAIAVRLNQNGSLDSSFSFPSSISTFVNGFLVLPDGKIMVAGKSTYLQSGIDIMYNILRINSNGSLDTTFFCKGATGFNAYTSTFAQQPDGKILVAGYFTNFDEHSSLGIARIETDGTVDTSFTSLVYGSYYTINSVLVRPNGNILIGGQFSSMQRTDIALLLPDGTGSSNFFQDPWIPYQGNNISLSEYSAVYKVLQQPDGKIVYGGNFGECAVTPQARNICRLLGNDYYLMNGYTRFDGDNNGCSTSDAGFTFLKHKLVNATDESYYYSGYDGQHGVFLKNGSSVVTPILDNPSWFSVSPSSVTVNMPSSTNYYNQNFCVTPIGSHHDVEVSIVPNHPPVPGLSATYKVKIKNNGNQVENGTVSFSFDDSLTSYLSSTPTAVVNGEQATWNFTGLQPFAQQEFNIAIEFNTPSETPALNSGDVLHFQANATISSDEIPVNNQITLNHAVVNSFDPNDKTCIEGATIIPAQVGDYVQYVIRFENTGTWPAQNIVVRDMIDTSKYDITTLAPLSGSHPFRTRITEGNKVEFMFDNIFLGYTDGTNDGYVSFKIKTKPSLALGDSFSNTADIYFDYNTPIVTNTATTVVQLPLGLTNNELESFTLYPVPARQTLFIRNPHQVTITTAAVYNMLGQLVSESWVNNNSVDVSMLAAGSYILKLRTQDGMVSRKFTIE